MLKVRYLLFRQCNETIQTIEKKESLPLANVDKARVSDATHIQVSGDSLVKSAIDQPNLVTSVDDGERNDIQATESSVPVVREIATETETEGNSLDIPVDTSSEPTSSDQHRMD